VNATPSSIPCLLLLCTCAAAGATEPAPVGAPAAAGYEDRLIDGGNLPIELDVDDTAGHNSAGWPRAVYAETVASRVSRDDASTNEAGIRFGGMLDTPDFGAFTLDATVRVTGHEGEESGNMITLMQRGMPVSAEWSMNSAVGMTYSPIGDLARSQARFFVPAIQMNGTAVEWQRTGGVQAFASYGKPAVYSGTYIPTVESLGGRQAGAGLQLNLDDHWSIAAQAVDVSSVPIGLDNSSPRISSRSWFGAVASKAGNARTQLNAAGSRIEDGEDAAGAWLDATILNGRISHSFGGFYLEPKLVWGNQQLASDAAGGYYRAAYRSQRWTLDGGADYVSSVSGDSGDVIFGTGYARYQHSMRLGYGGGTSVRRNLSDPDSPGFSPAIGSDDRRSIAWSAFGFVDASNRWGIGRGQVDYAQDNERDSAQLSLDQTWNTQVGQRLSTSILFGRTDFGSRTESSAGLAVFGGGSFGRNFSIDANARWNKAFGSADSDDLFANLAVNWGFAPGWTASASYYQNRSEGRFPLTVESPIVVDPVYERLDRSDSGIYLRVRYDWRAGRPTAPLGGSRGMGAGRIQGVLFLDDNDNGRLDASEAGAANVVVLLNGRFAVRTDASGRFEFPSVVAGNHSLSVVSDNLPLAWTVPAEARFDVRVGVRGQTQVELPAQRQR
jgi:hypothetical protein